jgi:hypothetical protein
LHSDKQIGILERITNAKNTKVGIRQKIPTIG